MTPTTTPLSLKEHLRNQTERGHRLLVNDLQALAAEKHNVGPAGSARAASHIGGPCAGPGPAPAPACWGPIGRRWPPKNTTSVPAAARGPRSTSSPSAPPSTR